MGPTDGACRVDAQQHRRARRQKNGAADYALRRQGRPVRDSLPQNARGRFFAVANRQLAGQHEVTVEELEQGQVRLRVRDHRLGQGGSSDPLRGV